MGKTLFEKIWDLHVIRETEPGLFLLAIDRIYLHDLCGAFSFQMLEQNGCAVLRPETVFPCRAVPAWIPPKAGRCFLVSARAAKNTASPSWTWGTPARASSTSSVRNRDAPCRE